MDEDERLFRVKTHVGIIVVADDLDSARSFIAAVRQFCDITPGVRFVHKDVSADKLWLKRGDIW